MNRLADETSPYLLQHAGNPVDWYPWGDEAFERARKEDKPMFVSIGYAACHWCHVMERESFESPTIAEQMNESFVCVKVDREERPDVDALYLDAAVVLNGSAGWPLNVFVMPDGRPFWAATYLPPEPRNGLRSIPGRARHDRTRLAASSARSSTRAPTSSPSGCVRSSTQKPVDAPVEEQLITDAVEALTYSFDWEWGGFGRAPKFPPGPTLEFMLRRDVPRLPEKTLDEMAAGGMYDVVGGGFHRYSTDQRWLVPHFEKMLYDNAQLAVVYLHGWQVLGKERYTRVVEETLEYMLRELAARRRRLRVLAGRRHRREGRPHLHVPALRPGARRAASRVRGRPLHRARRARRGHARRALRAAAVPAAAGPRRQGGGVVERPRAGGARRVRARPRPGRLGRRGPRARRVPARADEHRTAVSTEPGARGVAKGTGFLEDYADVSNGLLELHVATGELRWLEEANRLARVANELFYDDEHGGFFQAPSDGEQLIIRKKAFDDAPAPSGNSMLAYVLLKLSRIYGDDELEARALTVLKHELGGMQNAPTSFGWGLVAADFYLSKRREIAIAGGPDTELARAVLARFEPHAVIAFGPSDDVPLLAGKTTLEGKPAVYVCERFTCRVPIVNVADLARI